jgi:hypothetical protein
MAFLILEGETDEYFQDQISYIFFLYIRNCRNWYGYQN